MSSETSTESPGFRPAHVFVIATMLAASAAVLVARETSVENLLLVSLTVMAAGLAAMGFHRMLWPLVGEIREGRPAAVGGRTRLALEREKALVLRSIKELEFDRAMGKVADADFHDMVSRLRARAIGLMKQLDQGGASFRDEIEREVERRLAARRGAVQPAGEPAAARAAMPADRTPAALGDGKLAAAGAAPAPEAGAAAADAVAATRPCAACGTQNDPDARFCKRCGARLDTAPVAAAH